MIKREQLEAFAKRQTEINVLQHNLNNEFEKYKKDLHEKALEVLKWKDDNLGQQYLKYKFKGYIEKLKENHIVLCCPDTDYEWPSAYYNVYFDELYSDDWKEKALLEYQEKLKKKKEEERIKKEIELSVIEEKERLEYERLKLKFEGII